MTVILDTPLTLCEIKKATGANADLSEDTVVSKITTDSREADYSSLFIALDGRTVSGNDFIIPAKEKGAKTLAASPLADITVENSSSALLSIAEYYKKNHLKNIKRTVAITGSVGKTTTKEFLAKLLSDKHKIHATYKNYNNLLGVPITVLSAPKDTEILICELGMNSLGEIAMLSRCVRPDVSVITNIGTAHIGELGSREKIAEAKLEVLSGMQAAAALYVPYGEPLLEGVGAKTFSTSSKKGDVAVIGQNCVEIFLNGTKIGKSAFFLPEYHHRECLAAALCAALSIADSREVISSIPKITPRQTRAKIHKARNFYVLDDAYNASYESIEAALYQLFSLSEYKVKSVLLADVLELGDYSEEIHYKIGRLTASFSPERIYLYGAYAKHTLSGALSVGFPRANIYTFDKGEKSELTEKIKNLSQSGEIILIKGSHGMNLEKIIENLKS